MKKIVFAALGLLATSAHAADWASYKGCYEALTFNGKPVVNPLKDQNLIYEGSSHLLDPQTHEELNAINVFLYDKVDEESEDYGIQLPIFFDRGTTTLLPRGAKAVFAGDVSYQDEDENNGEIQTAHVTYELTLTEIDSTRRKVDYAFSVSQNGISMSDSGSTVMETAECTEGSAGKPTHVMPQLF